MVRNPVRRTALVDAAIEVLAHQGARGLTFRAVDAEAGVPIGTTSNYFTGRDDLLAQAGAYIQQRLAPDPAALGEIMKAPRDRGLTRALMGDLTHRVTDDRTGYLALLELRLEATRRPELRAALTDTVAAELTYGIDFNQEAGLPGDATTVTVLYLAMLGLIVEHLTLPGVLAGHSLETLVDRIVDTVVPDGNMVVPDDGTVVPDGNTVVPDGGTGEVDP